MISKMNPRKLWKKMISKVGKSYKKKNRAVGKNSIPRIRVKWSCGRIYIQRNQRIQVCKEVLAKEF